MDDSATMTTMHDHDLPLHAMEIYEKSTGLSVSLHVRDVRIWQMLPPSRSWHGSPICRAVKQFDDAGCMAFDVKAVQAEMLRRPGGFIKICHAGLVEWVSLVSMADAATLEMKPAIILFAGQAKPGSDLQALDPLCDDKTFKQTLRDDGDGNGDPTSRTRLPVVNAAQAKVHLELLCQLAARLEQWISRMMGVGWAAGATPGAMTGSRPKAGIAPKTNRDDSPSRSNTPDDRRRRIEFFIRQQHVNLVTIDDLAQALNLSPGRAAHVVRASVGRSFGQLLNEARVRTAASLLSHTSLSVLEVALRSGFGDVSNFHRRFKQQLSLSPLQYRKQVEVLTPLTISV